jgi:4-amino-4-deoxy-L-arabinose transferase-like glycosyltransferase
MNGLLHHKKTVIIAFFLTIFFVQSFVFLSSTSATWDETTYFGLGKYLMKNFRWDVPGSVLHPPLSHYISSVPLLFFNTNESVWEYKEEKNLAFLSSVDFVRGQTLLSSPQNDKDRLLILSRSMITLLSLLLGYFVYRFSNSLYGEKSGILSLFFFAFCPNMIAFAGLIVPDMSLTVFSFISIYYLWMSLKHGNIGDSLLSGLFLGLALLSKMTALFLFPIGFVLCSVYMVSEKKNVLKNMFLIFFCAVFVFFSGYAFDITPYLQGINFQWNHAVDGHPSFLMGEYSKSGWWYYHIVAFLLKTPIPVIVLFVSALALFFANLKKNWLDGLFLLVPIFFIIGFFCINHQSIGLRYILPIYPFIFVFIGSLLTFRKIPNYLIYALAVWYIGASLWISPHYLSYFNETIGGSDNGYKYLVDSNLDWGQDLKELKKFMDKNKIERVSLSYFGTDSPQRYGIRYDWLPSYYLHNPEPRQQPFVVPTHNLIAISVTNLQGVYFNDKNVYKRLEKYQPVAVIGHSIHVYDLRSPGQSKIKR